MTEPILRRSGRQCVGNSPQLRRVGENNFGGGQRRLSYGQGHPLGIHGGDDALRLHRRAASARLRHGCSVRCVSPGQFLKRPALVDVILQLVGLDKRGQMVGAAAKQPLSQPRRGVRVPGGLGGADGCVKPRQAVQSALDTGDQPAIGARVLSNYCGHQLAGSQGGKDPPMTWPSPGVLPSSGLSASRSHRFRHWWTRQRR